MIIRDRRTGAHRRWALVRAGSGKRVVEALPGAALWYARQQSLHDCKTPEEVLDGTVPGVRVRWTRGVVDGWYGACGQQRGEPIPDPVMVVGESGAWIVEGRCGDCGSRVVGLQSWGNAPAYGPEDSLAPEPERPHTRPLRWPDLADAIAPALGVDPAELASAAPRERTLPAGKTVAPAHWPRGRRATRPRWAARRRGGGGATGTTRCAPGQARTTRRG